MGGSGSDVYHSYKRPAWVHLRRLLLYLYCSEGSLGRLLLGVWAACLEGCCYMHGLGSAGVLPHKELICLLGSRAAAV